MGDTRGEKIIVMMSVWTNGDARKASVTSVTSVVQIQPHPTQGDLPEENEYCYGVRCGQMGTMVNSL